jgi:hypothetical protein
MFKWFPARSHEERDKSPDVCFSHNGTESHDDIRQHVRYPLLKRRNPMEVWCFSRDDRAYESYLIQKELFQDSRYSTQL